MRILKVDSFGGTPPQGVIPTGKYKVGKIITETYTTGRSTTSQSMIDLVTFSNYTGFSANSVLEFFWFVPTRNDGASWGGAYIEPFLSFDNGVSECTLGTCGHDGGVMCDTGGDIIHYYSNSTFIDPKQTNPYNVRARFKFCAYNQTIEINQSHNINTTSGSAGALSGNFDYHYMHYIIKELIPIQ